MTDTTTTEQGENPEGTPTPTPDPVKDAPRTEATDTTAPEDKGETAEKNEPAGKKASPAAEKKTPAKRKSTTTHKSAADTHKPGTRAHSEVEKDWEYVKPVPAITTRIQRALGRHGFYYGPADGVFETKSIQGVQRAITQVGFNGTANGHIGEEQARLIQVFAKQYGNYTGPVNKKLDANTWSGFAVGLERLR